MEQPDGSPCRNMQYKVQYCTTALSKNIMLHESDTHPCRCKKYLISLSRIQRSFGFIWVQQVYLRDCLCPPRTVSGRAHRQLHLRVHPPAGPRGTGTWLTSGGDLSDDLFAVQCLSDIQRSAKRIVRGWENFLPALAYLFCLALSGSCLARFAYFLADLCTDILAYSDTLGNDQKLSP